MWLYTFLQIFAETSVPKPRVVSVDLGWRIFRLIKELQRHKTGWSVHETSVINFVFGRIVWQVGRGAKEKPPTTSSATARFRLLNRLSPHIFPESSSTPAVIIPQILWNPPSVTQVVRHAISGAAPMGTLVYQIMALAFRRVHTASWFNSFRKQFVGNDVYFDYNMFTGDATANFNCNDGNTSLVKSYLHFYLACHSSLMMDLSGFYVYIRVNCFWSFFLYVIKATLSNYSPSLFILFLNWNSLA